MTTVANQASDLARFLISRIDDDESELRSQRRHETRGTGPARAAGSGYPIERMLAECEAKRAVIAHAQQLLVLRDQPSEKPVRDLAYAILQTLAEPYGEHLGYRSEWQIRRHR